MKDQSYVSPHSVRRLLTQSAVPLDSDLGMFVGVAAYEAAGGNITRDLFSAEDEGFMDDAALVRRLALEKLEAKAAELRPGWAWTKALLDPEYGFLAQYGRVRPQPVEIPAEIAEEFARIDERLAEFDEMAGDQWTDELMEEANELEERRDQLARSVAGLAVYAEADRARAGCIVTIGDDGDFRLHEGLVERSAPRDGGAADHCEARRSRRRGIRLRVRRGRRHLRPLPRLPSRLCARNAGSARSWSTISRRTVCRLRRRISRAISGWRSTSRSIRSASSCSMTGIAFAPSI